MNNQSKVENGIVIQSNNAVHCFEGRQGEFGRILTELRTEIEKLETIKVQVVWRRRLKEPCRYGLYQLA